MEGHCQGCLIAHEESNHDIGLTTNYKHMYTTKIESFVIGQMNAVHISTITERFGPYTFFLCYTVSQGMSRTAMDCLTCRCP